MKFREIKIGLIFLLTAFTLFWWRGAIFLDPDFGWHLRLGKIIADSGIPKTDPFSYTMPSFPFVAHECLTDVLITKLYFVLGQIGLAAIYTILALLTIFISTTNPLSRKMSSKKLNPWYLRAVPLVLGTGIILGYSGIRPQVQSWLFLAILLRILLSHSIWKRWHLTIPFFIILWANLHGSFAIGIATLLLVVFLKSWRKRKLWLKGLMISIFSLLATIVNPYGARLWWEVYLTISDTSLRWTIAEWHPAVFVFNPSFIALLTLSLILILRYRKRFRLEEIGLYFFFLLQGLSSLRHIPLWTIMALPITVTGLNWFFQEAKQIKQGAWRFEKAYNFAIAGSLIIFTLQSAFGLLGVKSLTEEAFYPKKAVAFLKTNLPKGQIFSEYGWGGYLIWKLPEKKVFIDGRMPSWRWKTYPSQESSYAMKEYGEITSGKTEYLPIFEKYGIDTVLWSPPKPKSIGEQLENKLKNLLIGLGIGNRDKDFDFLQQFQKDGWQEIYKDSVAVIYQKSHQLTFGGLLSLSKLRQFYVANDINTKHGFQHSIDNPNTQND